ncbi:uncharacterized protein LOC126801776 [Argentina anserina]|uniref:uncharacterized protein LOC126801776 n=1 Tax=Argentina anserina TaxID=57926 RepID=UPI00217635E3|nr:uncharacterized protein LOC126801776 [Potentilla anserina]
MKMRSICYKKRAKSISLREKAVCSEIRVGMAAFQLSPSERSDLLQHVVRLLTTEPEKEVLIGLFVRLLIQGSDNTFAFLKELDQDSPVFFNLEVLDQYMKDGLWTKAEEYLGKFLEPGHHILAALRNICDDAELSDDSDSVSNTCSKIFYAIERERDRIVNEMELKPIHHIPLFCLVDVVKSQANHLVIYFCLLPDY